MDTPNQNQNQGQSANAGQPMNAGQSSMPAQAGAPQSSSQSAPQPQPTPRHQPPQQTMASGAPPVAEPHNVSPTTESMTKPVGNNTSSSIGPIIGVVIIVGVLLVGGYYFFVSRTAVDTPSELIGEVESQDDAQVEALLDVSQSDDLNAIEGDLEASNFGDLDSGLDSSLDSEL